LLSTVPGLSSFDEAPAATAGEGALWILHSSLLDEIEPNPPSLGPAFPVDQSAQFGGEVVISSARIWLTSRHGVATVAPATGDVLRNYSVTDIHAIVGALPSGLAGGGRFVWLTLEDGTLARIDPRSGQRTVRKVAQGADWVTFGDGAVWVIDQVAGQIIKVDPRTLRTLDVVPLPGDLEKAVVGGGSLWVMDSAAGTITRVDTSTDSPDDPIRVGSAPSDLKYGFDSLWVSDIQDGTISQIDPVTDLVKRTIHLGAPVGAVAVDVAGGCLWGVIAAAPSHG
jgi:streptogramin lyase